VYLLRRITRRLEYIWHLRQVHAIQGNKICLGKLPPLFGMAQSIQGL
jgi:hypothetical protein